MRKWSERIDRAHERLGSVVSWLLLAMVLIGAFNAVARYLGRFMSTNLSSNAWLELQWYLFSLVFLLGAAYTLKQDAHVRVDVLYGRFSARGQAWVDFLGTLFFLLPFAIFGIWTSLPSVRESWKILEVSNDPGGLPRYPLKTFIPIAFVLLFLQGLSEAHKAWRTLREKPSSREEEVTP